MNFLVITTSGVAFGFLLTFLAKNLAQRWKIFDLPSSRKMQTVPVPYLGGVSVMSGFLVLVWACSAMRLPVNFEVNSSWKWILGTGIFVVLLGLSDDILRIHYKYKLMLQIVTAATAGLIWSLSDLRSRLFDSQLMQILITLVFLVVVMNAANFFDNMDGLLSGSAVVVLVTYFFFGVSSNQTEVAVLSLGLASSLTGFLVWNFPQARIYLGDAGSLFLGYMIGMIALVLVFPNYSPGFSGIKTLLPLLPILLDAILVVVFRLYRGIHPASPGKDHVSHRLLLLSGSKQRTVLEIWVWILVTSLSSLFFESDRQIMLILPILVMFRMFYIYLKTEAK